MLDELCLIPVLEGFSPRPTPKTLKGYNHMYRPTYVKISASFRYNLVLVLQYVHDNLQSQIGTIGPCYIVWTRGMQSLNAGVHHLQFDFGGTERECTS